jgi:hypothetical protein
MEELIATPEDVEEVIKLFLSVGHNFRTKHLQRKIYGVRESTS